MTQKDFWTEAEEKAANIHWEEWEKPVIEDGQIKPKCLAKKEIEREFHCLIYVGRIAF